MTIPASREDLKQYALRALGKPVIEINVDDDQLEDRLDESLQLYAQYHSDGIRRTYLKYKLTQNDFTRIISSTPVNETDVDSGNNIALSNVVISSTTGNFTCNATTLPLTVGQSVTITGTLTGIGTIPSYTGVSMGNIFYIIATNGSTTFQLAATNGGPAITTGIGSTTGLSFVASTVSTGITTTWYEAQNYIVCPPQVVSVVNVFPFTNSTSMSMFDVRYQLRLNDLYDFASTSIINYDMVMRHLDFLDMILVGKKPIRFEVHSNRLYVDMDWAYDLTVGQYLIIEAYRAIDPNQQTQIYNDIWLKRYVTAKFKLQWGNNLSKFDGIQMLGGVKLNGAQIQSEAVQEIQKLEETLQNGFQEAPIFIMG